MAGLIWRVGLFVGLMLAVGVVAWFMNRSQRRMKDRFAHDDLVFRRFMAGDITEAQAAKLIDEYEG